MTFDRHEILKAHYRSEIEGWNWAGIKSDAANNTEPANGYDDGEMIGQCYLGTVMGLLPSGKYCMPWCSNQTSHDEQRDSAYFEALEEVADENGMWIESGEGDPCDLYACVAVETIEA